MTVNIAEAKANLARLVEMAARGERVIVACNNCPIADLVVHKNQGKRKLGLLTGKLTIPDDFNVESDEINAMFYGKS